MKTRRTTTQADENLILSACVTSKRALSEIASLSQREFATPHANIVYRWCQSHYETYGEAPGPDVIKTEFAGWSDIRLQNNPADATVEAVEKFLSQLTDAPTNNDLVSDKISLYFSRNSLKTMLEEARDAIALGDVRNAADLVSSWKPTEIGGDASINVFGDEDAIRNCFEEGTETLVHFPGDLGRFFGRDLARDSLVSFLAAEKRGKDLALDTIIPTPTGFTTMGEVSVGDVVISSDGKPTKVVFKSEVFNHDCFEVTTTCGQKLVAGRDHQWWVKQGHETDWRVMTTGQLIDAGVTTPQGRNKWAIKPTQPMIGVKQDFHIDPYTLGVWLGDGSSKQPYVYGLREDLEQYPGVKLMGKDHRSQCWCGKFTTFTTGDLKELGIYKNKHIPIQYFLGSYEQRLALVQGLIDTDGHIMERGAVEITLKRYEIVKGLIKLLNSLGIVVKSEPNVKTVNGVDYYRITFSSDVQVARLPRKVSKLRKLRGRVRKVASITPTLSVPTQCISVDAPDESYLVGDNYIVTHNTSWMRQVAWQAMREKRNVAFIGLGDMTQPQYMKEFMRMAAKLPDYEREVTIPTKCWWHPKESKKVLVKTFGKHLPALDVDTAIAAAREVMETSGNLPRLKLAAYPNSTMGVSNIESLLDRWERGGWIPDVVILDYADLLLPPNGYKDDRDGINQNWKMLRRMSQERHCLVLTATQAAARGYDKWLLDMGCFSEDKRKLSHVTSMIGINRTPEESVIDVCRLNVIARRNGLADVTKPCIVAGCRDIGHIAIRSCY